MLVGGFQPRLWKAVGRAQRAGWKPIGRYQWRAAFDTYDHRAIGAWCDNRKSLGTSSVTNEMVRQVRLRVWRQRQRNSSDSTVEQVRAIILRRGCRSGCGAYCLRILECSIVVISFVGWSIESLNIVPCVMSLHYVLIVIPIAMEVVVVFVLFWQRSRFVQFTLDE